MKSVGQNSIDRTRMVAQEIKINQDWKPPTPKGLPNREKVNEATP